MQKDSSKPLDCIEMNPEEHPSKTIIWLHGLGADGNDFTPIVPELNISDQNIRFVFPHAPIRPVTVNNGFKMRAWFDVYDLDISSKIDEEGIKASMDQVNALIERELEMGMKPEDIVLVGFSQGAVIAMLTGLTQPNPIAGVIALSGFLPHADWLTNKTTPIFLAHGTDDPVVPYRLGEHTRSVLEDDGFNVSWHSYLMQHSVCPDEIRDIREWLLAL